MDNRILSFLNGKRFSECGMLGRILEAFIRRIKNGIWEYVVNLNYLSCFVIAKISRKPTQRDNNKKEKRFVATGTIG